MTKYSTNTNLRVPGEADCLFPKGPGGKIQDLLLSKPYLEKALLRAQKARRSHTSKLNILYCIGRGYSEDPQRLRDSLAQRAGMRARELPKSHVEAGLRTMIYDKWMMETERECVLQVEFESSRPSTRSGFVSSSSAGTFFPSSFSFFVSKIWNGE